MRNRSIYDIAHMDTEFFKDEYLHRKTLAIDPETGKTKVYQDGGNRHDRCSQII